MQAPAYIAISQQAALQRQTEVIANNLANISTPAFKADRLVFQEFVQNAGDAADPTAQMSFVREVGSLRDLREGAMIPTGNSFDFAIAGPGYFVVQTPGGNRYTRQGSFQLDGKGQVVTIEGFPLLDKTNRPIVKPAGSNRFEVSPSGTIVSDAGPIGQFQVVTFTDEQSMKKSGAGMFDSDAAPQPADAKTTVRQGMIEGSNVQSILEVTSLIEISRRYQAAQNMLNTENDLSLKAIQQLGKVAA